MTDYAAQEVCYLGKKKNIFLSENIGIPFSVPFFKMINYMRGLELEVSIEMLKSFEITVNFYKVNLCLFKN